MFPTGRNDTTEIENIEPLKEDNLPSRKKGDQSNEEELNPNTGQRTSLRIRAKPTWVAEYDM